jgi:hypothetical protein
MLNYRPIGVGSAITGIARYWAFRLVVNLPDPMKGN